MKEVIKTFSANFLVGFPETKFQHWKANIIHNSERRANWSEKGIQKKEFMYFCAEYVHKEFQKVRDIMLKIEK